MTSAKGTLTVVCLLVFHRFQAGKANMTDRLLQRVAVPSGALLLRRDLADPKDTFRPLTNRSKMELMGTAKQRAPSLPDAPRYACLIYELQFFNDAVMGSQSRFKMLGRAPGLLFEGNVPLDNCGCLPSFRAPLHLVDVGLFGLLTSEGRSGSFRVALELPRAD